MKQDTNRLTGLKLITIIEMEKTKEECLLMNGILRCDLGNNESKILKAMDDWAEEVVKNCNAPTASKAKRIANAKAYNKGYFKGYCDALIAAGKNITNT